MDRTPAVFSALNQEHFRFRRRSGLVAGESEIGLTDEWICRLEAPESGLTLRMMADFKRFSSECLEVNFADTGTRAVVWRMLGDPLSAENFDRQDPEVEAFSIRVESDRVEISARHERGLLQGTHYLEWMMADRGGPFLRPGSQERKPAFQPRISNGVFVEGHQTLENPGQFSDEYLSLMSHYGVNGIHLYTSVWEVFRSEILPELNAAEGEVRIAKLRELNRRTLGFGIDLYLHLNTHPLGGDHPVFAAHPEVRGAQVEIFFEGVTGRDWFNLCSGSEKVRTGYAEAMEELFSAAPELAGAVMIIGGECFYHCFTRPAGADNGDTNCPHCQGKSPSEEVARLVNRVAAGVKATGNHKALYAWPYSAWIWSAHDPAEVDWISGLDPSVSVLSNFDGYDEDLGTGGGVRLFDYNITCIGPSTTFARQAERCREMGRPIFTKVETCTTPDAFFLPYLPLLPRWQARLDAMKKTGVAGFIGQWRFYGMNASPPEELQYRATWENDGERAMENICRRDFGLDDAGTSQTLGAWKLLSAAWEHFPYSAMTSGERAAYMRGPFYLGPAHPLIFDVQDSYQLPVSFRLLRGDAKEMVAPEEFEELQRLAKPRYVSDLLVTLPFGVERYLELLRSCRADWQAGLETLRTALSGQGERAERELGVVETIDSHLRTLENVVKFYQARDVLQNTACDPAAFKTRLATLQEIASDEIANAERMLSILEADPRLGYGYCYGPVYDAEMVRAKIVQCRFVRDVELPRFSQVVRFHVWLESP